MINVTDKGLVTLHQRMSLVGDSIAIAAQQMLGSPLKTVHLKEEEGKHWSFREVGEEKR